MINKENRLEGLIKEDLVNYQSPNSGKGYDWHNRTNPMQMSLVDILKIDRADYEKAKKVLPHEIQTTLEKILTIVDQVDELKNDFVRAYNKPMIQDSSEKKDNIKGIVRDLNSINQKYIDVVKKLDQFQL